MLKPLLTLAVVLAVGITLSSCRSAGNDISQVPSNQTPAPAVSRGYRNVSEAQMRDLMKKGVPLVDVRQPQEFRSGHVPGAVLVPLNSLPQAAAGWDKQKPLIVICLSGSRSSKAADYLVSQGFNRVYNFPDGMMGYKGPVTAGDK